MMSQDGMSPEIGGLLRGFWQYLVARLQVRAELGKERERNRMYAEHRDRLAENCELLDSEGGQGRVLWIRKGPQPTSRAVTRFRATLVLPGEASSATGIGAIRPRSHADGR